MTLKRTRAPDEDGFAPSSRYKNDVFYEIVCECSSAAFGIFSEVSGMMDWWDV